MSPRPQRAISWGRGSVEYSSGITLFSFRETENGLIGRRQPPDQDADPNFLVHVLSSIATRTYAKQRIAHAKPQRPQRKTSYTSTLGGLAALRERRLAWRASILGNKKRGHPPTCHYSASVVQ